MSGRRWTCSRHAIWMTEVVTGGPLSGPADAWTAPDDLRLTMPDGCLAVVRHIGSRNAWLTTCNWETGLTVVRQSQSQRQTNDTDSQTKALKLSVKQWRQSEPWLLSDISGVRQMRCQTNALSGVRQMRPHSAKNAGSVPLVLLVFCLCLEMFPWHCILDAVSFIVVEYANHFFFAFCEFQCRLGLSERAELSQPKPSHVSSWTMNERNLLEICLSISAIDSFAGISATDSLTHMSRSSESIRRSTFYKFLDVIVFPTTWLQWLTVRIN